MASEVTKSNGDHRHQKRAEFAFASLASAIEQKSQIHFYGKLTINLDFEDGKIRLVTLTDQTTYK